MTLTHESKYHILILTLYAFFCIYFFFFNPYVISHFVFNKTDFQLFLPLALGAFASFFVINFFLSFGKLTLKKESLLRISLLILYASIFAIPEEIIFRGIIQEHLSSFLSPVFAIIIASTIYGLAHIQNGASGLTPSKWNWKFVIITSVVGIFLGLAYHLTGGLILPIALHALFIFCNQAFIKQL